MSKASWVIIIAQVLDVVTTVIGLEMGMKELNPLGFNMGTIAFKAFCTFAVVWLIERWRKLKPIAWVPAVFASIVVAWNLINILFGLML